MSGEWVRDENGTLRRETIHRMGRRCRNWDYRCDAVYLITLVLADRSQPVLGRLVIDEPKELARGRASATAIDPETVKAHIELSELGRRIEEHWRKIGEFTPEIKPLAVQLMPEHLHGVLWVRRNMKKPLGDALRGFKSGATKIYFTTAAFDEKLGDLLAAAKHGAVLVSPCVSDGEKEIAARAFAAGASVVTLNRIAQLICGTGAATINYRGAKLDDVDALVANAVAPTHSIF